MSASPPPTPVPPPLARASVVDELAAALRTRILAGELAPGTPLREIDVARAYAVSRHTLRAALRALAGEGLVEIVANRGARVTRLDREALVALFELRTAIELEACRLALRRGGGRLPETVHTALADLVRACRERDAGWHRVADAHAALHGALVAASASPRLVEAYGRLEAELRLFLAELRPVWPLRRMIGHHRDLVRDLEATGDVEHLRAHLEDGLAAVTGGLRR